MTFLVLVCNAIGTILYWIITIYCWIIFIGAILNLARADPSSNLVVIINRLTYPAYAALKKFIKTEYNGLELAPFLIILIAQFINLTVARFLMGFH
ncbi:YggT family protein [Helicobacter aurati]|uniref:YggT family protein n=1 Tax=Helicobacter aurati TaxID=137778 RepID=UPI001F2190C3|nr:YggT family protein [Helicobacter aurati]